MEPDLILCEGDRSFVSSGNNEFKPVEGKPLIFSEIYQNKQSTYIEDLPQASAGLFGIFMIW